MLLKENSVQTIETYFFAKFPKKDNKIIIKLLP